MDDAEVYGKHAEELVRFATLLVGPSAAEDVVADAVVRAFSSPAWPGVREPRPYLYRSVLNEARRARRTAERRLRREARAAVPETVDEAVVRPEVVAALLRLTMRERAVIFATYWLDRDANSTAHLLGLSRRTVERELRRARHHLEELLR
jgi:RNA polymerase sigma-70 factor (ECF subfamily)